MKLFNSFQNITWYIYFNFFKRKTKNNQIKLLNNWLNYPDIYNDIFRRADSGEEIISSGLGCFLLTGYKF